MLIQRLWSQAQTNEPVFFLERIFGHISARPQNENPHESRTGCQLLQLCEKEEKKLRWCRNSPTIQIHFSSWFLRIVQSLSCACLSNLWRFKCVWIVLVLKLTCWKQNMGGIGLGDRFRWKRNCLSLGVWLRFIAVCASLSGSLVFVDSLSVLSGGARSRGLGDNSYLLTEAKQRKWIALCPIGLPIRKQTRDKNTLPLPFFTPQSQHGPQSLGIKQS